jgi:hypothetical protein
MDILNREYKKNIDFDINKIDFEIEETIKDKKVLKINGINSKDYDNFYIAFVTADEKSTTIDSLVFEFEEENFPSENTKDNMLCIIEKTKNSPKEAGNMLEQRSGKSISFFEKFGYKIPYYFYISSKIDIDSFKNEMSQVHYCGFSAIKAINPEYTHILISKQNSLEYEEYTPPYDFNNLSIMVTEENKKSNCGPGIKYKVFYDETKDEYLIQVNLTKKQGDKLVMNNDPGKGYLISRSELIRRNAPNAKIVLINHGIKNANLIGNGKLLNSISKNGIYVDFGYTQMQLNGCKVEYKWKYDNKGEKISSIFYEILMNKKDIKTIFSSHASGEKSYIINLKGNSILSKNTKGQPDWVGCDVTNKTLHITEAEQSKNLNKGIKQINNPKFDEWILENFKDYLENGYSYIKKITTTGEYKKNNIIAFNVTNDTKISVI